MTSPGREGEARRFFGYYNQAFLSTVDVKLKDFTRNGKENRGPHAKELGAVVSARARLISASKEKDDDDDHHCRV